MTTPPDPATRAAYDAGAATYAANRSVRRPEFARSFDAAAPPGPRLDLGCGPGLWFPHLGRPLVGVDASGPMLDVATSADPGVPLVQAALEALPFADGAFAGIWANKCLQHVTADALPRVLDDLHRILRPDGRLVVTLFSGTGTFRSDDDLPGRRFTLWDAGELSAMLTGVGFTVDTVHHEAASGDALGLLRVEARRPLA